MEKKGRLWHFGEEGEEEEGRGGVGGGDGRGEEEKEGGRRERSVGQPTLGGSTSLHLS